MQAVFDPECDERRVNKYETVNTGKHRVISNKSPKDMHDISTTLCRAACRELWNVVKLVEVCANTFYASRT